MVELGGMSGEIPGGVMCTFVLNTRRKGSRVFCDSGINVHHGKLGF